MYSSDFSIRLCTLLELDDIMDLQDRICAAITQPDLFASTCREENASYLTPPNVIYGVFKQKRLIAYASLAFPKDAPTILDGISAGIPLRSDIVPSWIPSWSTRISVVLACSAL